MATLKTVPLSDIFFMKKWFSPIKKMLFWNIILLCNLLKLWKNGKYKNLYKIDRKIIFYLIHYRLEKKRTLYDCRLTSVFTFYCTMKCKKTSKELKPIDDNLVNR